jgi:hypothetical protein
MPVRSLCAAWVCPAGQSPSFSPYDGHQRGFDRGEIDPPSAPLEPSVGEVVLFEDGAGGVEIELGGDIEHGEILGVELRCALGGARCRSPRR